MTVNDQAHLNNQGQKKVPMFFREDYTGFIVKGNFMTLAAKFPAKSGNGQTCIDSIDWAAVKNADFDEVSLESQNKTNPP